MKDSLRSVFAAAGVSAGCLCIWWGSNLRDRLDVGTSTYSASSSNRVLSNFVASRDNQPNVPAVDYYSQMVSLLKQYYVEPIKDDDKLANGAVRGMIGSLGDPQSIYMEPDEFHAYLNREKGIYEGIGVDLALQTHGAKTSSTNVQAPPQDAEEAVATMSRFPSVVVTAVVPGGPADKVGVKVGDVVADIDGHWVVEDSLLERFKKARDAFNAKKLTFSQIEPLQKELRTKTERALLPGKTLSRLLVGTSGEIEVTWNRLGTMRSTKIAKGTSTMPDFGGTDPIVLPMSESGVKGLKGALGGRSKLTLDLRQDPEGSFTSMLSCLQLLAPSGRYGEIVNQRSEQPTLVAVSTGNPKPPKIVLLVGPSTHGPAEIFALALSSHGQATLEGHLPGGNMTIKQDVELPGGAGYEMAIGTYRPEVTKAPGTRGTVATARESSKVGIQKRSEVANADQSMINLQNGSILIQGGVN